MKNIGLGLLVVLSLAAVSCGKKDGGSGNSSTDPLSASSCNGKSGNINYAQKDARINWGTGEITIGKVKYSPQQVSPSSINVITQAYNNKGNVTGRTDGKVNAYGQLNITYRVTLRAALVPSTLVNGMYNGGMMNGGYMPVTGTTGTTSNCMLDIQTAKFRN